MSETEDNAKIETSLETENVSEIAEIKAPESPSGSLAKSTKAPESPSESLAKIEIYLKATANAPILKRKKWSVEHDRTIASINEFMRKIMKLPPEENLFLYVNQSFAPSPDQIIKNLYDCFGTDGKLNLHYSITPAWG